MLIEELITLGKMVVKEWKAGITKRAVIGGPRVRSISSLSNESSYFFPVVASEHLTTDEAIMISRAIERAYAMFTRTAFSIIPWVQVDSFDDATVRDYLSQFHNNMGVKTNFHAEVKFPTVQQAGITESSMVDFDYSILNENSARDRLYKIVRKTRDSTSVERADRFGPHSFGISDSNNKGYSSYLKDISSRTIIPDTDWKKANDLLPTIVPVPAKFIPKGSGEPVVVELRVNIKATMHKASLSNLVDDIVASLNQKKGILNFVKFVSREQRSAMDFLFGISQMKKEMLDSKGNPWLQAFKRRKRLASLAWGNLVNNFKPIATICITMNEVNVLKEKYNIDVFKEAEKIMKNYYLLGFLIADQVNEILYVHFDSQPGFQEYPYKTLEREAANQDRTIRDMIKAMGAFK